MNKNQITFTILRSVLPEESTCYFSYTETIAETNLYYSIKQVKHFDQFFSIILKQFSDKEG